MECLVVKLHLIKKLCLIKGLSQLVRVVPLVKLHLIKDTKSRGRQMHRSTEATLRKWMRTNSQYAKNT